MRDNRKVVATKQPIIIFPCDFQDRKKVDDEYKKEYEAAVAQGFEIILFDYDKWVSEEKLVLYPKSEGKNENVLAIYRGWMLKVDPYRHLLNTLSILGIDLINSPRNYMNLHLFPNVYEHIKADTARIMVFLVGVPVNLEAVKKTFSRFMVKDFVKSVKGTSFPKYFDNTVTQEEFDEQMKTFYQYRGDLYTGGICIKEFLDLKFYDEKPNEWRIFYINNEVGTVSRNSFQGNYTPEPPKELLKKYKDLDSQFYTVDYAELEDGSWKIMETGDGGVSGLSEGQDAESFYRALKIGLFQPEAKDITCGDCERLGDDFGCFACSAEDSAYHRGRICTGFINKKRIDGGYENGKNKR